MKVFAIQIGRDDDKPSVVSADVVKETPQFYMIGGAYRSAFGYSTRLIKDRFDTTPEGALMRYIAMRQRHRDNALATVAQAEAQIDVARELLASLKSATLVGAVATTVEQG